MDPFAVSFSVADPVADEHTQCPLVTTVEDMNSSQLYTDGVCSKCYPVTSYCRGHMGRIPLTHLHVSRVYTKSVKKLLSMMCVRCDWPIASLHAGASPKNIALHMHLVEMYKGNRCTCTGNLKDTSSVVDRMLAVYKVASPEQLWQVFRIGPKDKVLIRYLLVPPRKLLTQIPGGTDVLRAYRTLLRRVWHCKYQDEFERVQAVYAAYESVMKEKTGMLRQMLVPRRLGNSGRAVIVGNPHIGLGDIVVPDIMASKLCSDMRITHENIASCIASIQQQEVSALTYGRQRYKLASGSVYIAVTGLQGTLAQGSVVLDANGAVCGTYTGANVYDMVQLLQGYDAVAVSWTELVSGKRVTRLAQIPVYKVVTLYIDVVKDDIATMIPLQIGAYVAVAKSGQPLLVYRNPVLSANSMHTHTMVVAKNSTSLTMSTFERQTQRDMLRTQQWHLSLSDSASMRTQPLRSTADIHGTRIPGTDVYKVTSTVPIRAHCTVPVTNYALGLHPLAVGSYQGDFDGDEVNICEVPDDIDMSLLLRYNRDSYGLAHDAMYGCYCLVHGMLNDVTAVPIEDIEVAEYIYYLMSDADRVTVPHRFNDHLYAYAAERGISDTSSFYSRVAMYMNRVCDYLGVDTDIAVASKCRPSAATVSAMRNKVGVVTYTTPGDVTVVDMVQGNYATGVSEDEFLTLCYANRMQAVEKALAVAPEGDNMRLQCNYMSTLTERDNAWSNKGRIFYRAIDDTTLQCLQERRALELPRVYSDTVTHDAPMLPYRPLSELPSDLKDDRAKVLHVGQRKLLMCELDFLSDYAVGKEVVVVYAGAAPGTHVTVLLDLFPNVTFHMYDTKPFSSSLYSRTTHKPRDNVLLFEKYITVDIAATYKGKDVLYMSDIRSDAADDSVAGDNTLNMAVVQAMDPVAAMLKFRLPYSKGCTTLPQGELRHQCWGGPVSTEVRLVCTRPYTPVEYDHETHEQRMCHHNIIRPYALEDTPVSKHLKDTMHKVHATPYYDWYRETSIVSKYMYLTGKSEGHVYRLIEHNIEFDLMYYMDKAAGERR